MSKRPRAVFDEAAQGLLDRMLSAPVSFAKAYGRGQLDHIFNFPPSHYAKLPDSLKQELYAARRRWRHYQTCKKPRGEPMSKPADPIAPNTDTACIS